MTTIPEKLTAGQISDATGKTLRSVQIFAKKQNWSFSEVKGLGGKKRLYPFSSLPATIQIVIQKHYAPAPVPPVTGHLSSLPAETSHTQTLRTHSAAVGRLPHQADKVARARADLVAAYLTAKENGKSKKQKNADIINQFLQAYGSGLSFPQLYQTLGAVSRSTLERWRKDLEEANYDYHVLAPKWGRHRSGTTKLTERESQVLMTQVFHQNRVKTGTAITVTKYILELEGSPSPSSPATMRRAVDQFKNRHFDLWTFYREGEKALVDKVLPFIERDDSLIDVGDVLVADGHRCNFRVKNPWTGKPCRPMLVGFYDWKSRILCGWSISLEENTQLITAALRNGIIRLGKTPKIVLLDNGAAFKSKVFTGDMDLEQSGIRGMFARLDIKTVFAWPYNARSKPIERFFGDFSNQFERFMPSFSGASITDKPASLMRNEKLMQAFYKENVMEIPQVMAALEKWWDFHAWTQHPTLKGKQKGQVFESGRGPGIDQGKLNDLMLDSEIKRIGRNGISFLGADYFHESLYGLREQVVIRYDFCDIAHVHVYAKNGDYICRADRKDKVHPMAALLGKAKDVEDLKFHIGQQRSLKKQTTKIARQALDMTGDMEIVKALPWDKIVEAAPDLPEKVERIEAEYTGLKALEAVPVIDAESLPELPEPDTEKSQAEVIPFFATDADYYNHLAGLVRPLSESEILFLEEFYRTESGKAFLQMDGRLKTATAEQ